MIAQIDPFFPVKVPYTISADISKYEGAEFNKHPNTKIIEEKLNEISRMGSDLYGVTPGKYELVRKVSRHLKISPETAEIQDIALALEEDFAIMENGSLAAICFCFPSGFIPTKKLGLPLMEIHGPVADGDKLRRASEGISSVTSKEGAKFRRYVWTLTTNPGLSQHPDYGRPDPESIDDIYFRKETQTTLGLGEGISLFFVKVDMLPLRPLWESLEKRKTLLESLNSMSQAVLEYKGLTKIKEILNSSINQNI